MKSTLWLLAWFEIKDVHTPELLRLSLSRNPSASFLFPQINFPQLTLVFPLLWPTLISSDSVHHVFQRGPWRQYIKPLQRHPFLVGEHLDLETPPGGRSGSTSLVSVTGLNYACSFRVLLTLYPCPVRSGLFNIKKPFKMHCSCWNTIPTPAIFV